MHFVVSKVARNDRGWKQWFDKDAPEEAQIPDGYHISLDSFRKLLLIRLDDQDLGKGVTLNFCGDTRPQSNPFSALL